MKLVSALFVDKTGPYFSMEQVDPWDEARDATLYRGNGPVVLHPPCGRWCRMAYVNQKRWGAQVGADNGLFSFALATLHRCGGVLEHPAFSIAWKKEWFDLPRPPNSGEWIEQGGLWACEVWQSDYGHPARKRTWLLYKGQQPPFPLLRDQDSSKISHQVGGGINTGNNRRPRLSQSLTHLSPLSFAQELVRLAIHSTQEEQ